MHFNQMTTLRMRLALAAIVGAACATAATATTTLTPSADATIQLGDSTNNQANTNYGTGDLVAKYDGTDTGAVDRKAYIRYNLSSVTGTINSATLQLTVSVNNGGSTNTTPQNFTFEVYGLNPGSTAGNGFQGQNWVETGSGTGITWNNAPANIVSGSGAGSTVQTGAGTSNGGQAVDLGSFSITTADTSGTTFTAITGGAGSNLVNFLDAAQADAYDSATFIITRTGWTTGGGTPTPSTGSSNSTFFSRDASIASERPTLTVSAVPEPASLALLAPAALALLRRRK